VDIVSLSTENHLRIQFSPKTVLIIFDSQVMRAGFLIL
jgi:hypothetical protein